MQLYVQEMSSPAPPTSTSRPSSWNCYVTCKSFWRMAVSHGGSTSGSRTFRRTHSCWRARTARSSFACSAECGTASRSRWSARGCAHNKLSSRRCSPRTAWYPANHLPYPSTPNSCPPHPNRVLPWPSGVAGGRAPARMPRWAARSAFGRPRAGCCAGRACMIS